MRLPLSILLTSVIFFYTATGQNVIEIPTDYNTIQEGLDIASPGDTILVAPGTYFENIKWPATDSLTLKGTGGSSQTIIDGSKAGVVLLKNSGARLTMAIKGFTVQNGETAGSGAGIFILTSVVYLDDLRVRNNKILDTDSSNRRGAGISLHSCAGSLRDSELSGNHIFNTIISSGPNEHILAPRGAGMDLVLWNPLDTIHQFDLENVSFSNNTTEAECRGGGLYIEGAGAGAIANITNCKFEENSATLGSAIYFENTNLVGREGLSASIKNSEISHNINIPLDWERGSAIYVENSHMRLSLENCLLAHNEGLALELDAVVWQLDPLNVLNINHCTFAQNEYGLFARSSEYKIENSIFWNRFHPEIEDDSRGINPSKLDLSHNVIKNGNIGINTITENPQFISDDNLIPASDSPCIGAGLPTAGLTSDILGLPRPRPTGTVPDIGAFEVDQSNVLALDILDLKAEYDEENRIVNIDWNVGQEFDMDYYVVEKSINNTLSFVKIGQEKAVGRSLYTYYDRDINRSGTFYYRVRNVGLDGTYEYSEVVAVKVDNLLPRNPKLAIAVYPNPVNNVLAYDLYTNLDFEVESCILDLSGQLLKVETTQVTTGYTRLETDLTSLAAGTYILSVKLGDKITARKITKVE